MLENRVAMLMKQNEIKTRENTSLEEKVQNLTLKYQNLQNETEMKNQDMEALLSQRDFDIQNLNSVIQKHKSDF